MYLNGNLQLLKFTLEDKGCLNIVILHAKNLKKEKQIALKAEKMMNIKKEKNKKKHW